MSKPKLLTLLLIVAFLALAIFVVNVRTGRSVLESEGPPVTNKDMETTQDTPRMRTVAKNLEVPWAIAFLPGGDMLVTERPGRLVRIGENGVTHTIEGVAHTSEGGLLGLALHPEFEENGFVYLYLTTRTEEGLENRVERYVLNGDELREGMIVLSGVPGAENHDGGRMAFGPDGKLYITTGDAQQEERAQDRTSLHGKILRVNDDGSVPPDNPFGNEVWSYGHRNPQGLAWDTEGRLWSTEHGRSGIRSGFDEVNVIERGGNYGWPNIQGGERSEGMIAPLTHSGSTTTWAPASAAYLDGSLYFGGLRGEALYEAVIEGDKVARVIPHLKGELGRIREVVVSPDGLLIITTSNTDGRGRAREGDDSIIEVNPSKL